MKVIYPEEILGDLMENFTPAAWTILDVLAGTYDENNQRVDEPQPIILSISDLKDRIVITNHLFKNALTLLEGAKAVHISKGKLDTRSKEVTITMNGLRMIELKQVLGGHINA